MNKHVKVCGKDGEPKFTCHVCGAILSSKNGLKEHLDRHSKTPSVVCHYCGKKFFNKSKRSSHYLTCVAKKQYDDAKLAKKEEVAKAQKESGHD